MENDVERSIHQDFELGIGRARHMFGRKPIRARPNNSRERGMAMPAEAGDLTNRQEHRTMKKDDDRTSLCG